MRVADILTQELVIPQLRSGTKTDVLRELAYHLAAHQPRADLRVVGEGIAIPHGKLPGLKGVVTVFGRSQEGIDCHSLDGALTKLFFLLVAPEDSTGVHLKALARVSRLLKDKAFRERLLRSTSQAELYRIICEEDAKL